MTVAFSRMTLAAATMSSTRSPRKKPAAVLAFDLWQGAAENKRGRRRSPRRHPRICTTAHACNCNGAPPAHGHRRGRRHKNSPPRGQPRKAAPATMGCTNSKDDDFAAHTLENDELFIDGHFKEVVPEAAEKPSTTFVRGQPKPTSWLVGNGSPTQAPVTRRRSWDALPPKAQSPTPVRVAKLTTELDALSARLAALGSSIREEHRVAHQHDAVDLGHDQVLEDGRDLELGRHLGVHVARHRDHVPLHLALALLVPRLRLRDAPPPWHYAIKIQRCTRI